MSYSLTMFSERNKEASGEHYSSEGRTHRQCQLGAGLGRVT